MPITKTTALNEFFVRMTDDGTAIQGVHVCDIERIVEDGAVLSAKMLPPRPVDASDSAALGVIASAFNLSALATVDSQAAQITALTSGKATVESERDSALSQSSALQARITELEAMVKDLTTPGPVSLTNP